MCEQVELPVPEQKISEPNEEGIEFITDETTHTVIGALAMGRLHIVPRAPLE